MSKPPKIDRKGLKSPDDFVKKGTELLGLMAARQLPIIPVLVGIGLILVGIYAYDSWEDSQREKALVAYYEAGKKTEPEKWDALKKVADGYKGQRAAELASVDVADRAFQQAKKAPAGENPSAKEAAEWYSKALEFRGLNQVEKQLLYMDRGASYELSSKWDEALSDYKSAADLGGDLKAFALLGTARVMESKSDQAQAIETYEKVAADFANTEYGKMARNHARRLKSPLFATPKKS